MRAGGQFMRPFIRSGYLDINLRKTLKFQLEVETVQNRQFAFRTNFGMRQEKGNFR